MEYPLVSAIITTHNRKDLVIGAIKSVMDQTYPNIETIVVDDGSTDGTEKYIEETLKDASIRYFYNADMPGGNHARNIGIKHSKGEYLAFLDDDDEWMPSKIEKQVRYYLDNPESAFVGCARIDEYDFRERYCQNPQLIPEGDLSKTIFNTFLFTSSCMMVRKDKLLKAGFFDESLEFWQDYELQIRLCQIGKVGMIRENLTLYRIIAKDGERKTNRFEGWMQAVEHIQNKHQDLIGNLPEKMLIKMKLLMIDDGIYRAEICGRRSDREKLLAEKAFYEKKVEEIA